MCQYYHSIYQCGHERDEVTECLIAIHQPPTKRCEKTRANNYGNVVQPCGCLQAYQLEQITKHARGFVPPHPTGFAPFREMDNIWKSFPHERSSPLNRHELLIERKHALLHTPAKYFCMGEMDRMYRQSTAPLEEKVDVYEIGAMRAARDDRAAFGRTRVPAQQASGARRVDSMQGSMDILPEKDPAVQEAITDILREEATGTQEDMRAPEYGRLSPASSTPEWIREG